MRTELKLDSCKWDTELQEETIEIEVQLLTTERT